MIYKAEFSLSESNMIKFLASIGLKVELEEREFLDETRRDVKRITQKVRIVRHCCNNEEYPGQEQRGYRIPHEWELVNRIIENIFTAQLKKLLMQNLTSDVTLTPSAECAGELVTSEQA